MDANKPRTKKKDSAASDVTGHGWKIAASQEGSTDDDGHDDAWTVDEHEAFLDGLDLYGRDWNLIASTLVKTRTRRQVEQHALEHFGQRLDNDVVVGTTTPDSEEKDQTETREEDLLTQPEEAEGLLTQPATPERNSAASSTDADLDGQPHKGSNDEEEEDSSNKQKESTETSSPSPLAAAGTEASAKTSTPTTHSNETTTPRTRSSSKKFFGSRPLRTTPTSGIPPTSSSNSAKQTAMHRISQPQSVPPSPPPEEDRALPFTPAKRHAAFAAKAKRKAAPPRKRRAQQMALPSAAAAATQAPEGKKAAAAAAPQKKSAPKPTGRSTTTTVATVKRRSSSRRRRSLAAPKKPPVEEDDKSSAAVLATPRTRAARAASQTTGIAKRRTSSSSSSSSTATLSELLDVAIPAAAAEPKKDTATQETSNAVASQLDFLSEDEDDDVVVVAPTEAKTRRARSLTTAVEETSGHLPNHAATGLVGGSGLFDDGDDDGDDPWDFLDNELAPVIRVYRTVSKYGLAKLQSVCEDRSQMHYCDRLARLVTSIHDSCHSRGYDLDSLVSALERLRGLKGLFTFAATLEDCGEAEKLIGPPPKKKVAVVLRPPSERQKARSPALEPQNASQNAKDVLTLCEDPYVSLLAVHNALAGCNLAGFRAAAASANRMGLFYATTRVVRAIDNTLNRCKSCTSLDEIVAALERIRGNKALTTFANRLVEACLEAEILLMRRHTTKRKSRSPHANAKTRTTPRLSKRRRYR